MFSGFLTNVAFYVLFEAFMVAHTIFLAFLAVICHFAIAVYLLLLKLLKLYVILFSTLSLENKIAVKGDI